MAADDAIVVRLTGPMRERVVEDAHRLQLSHGEYIKLALDVAHQLPDEMVLCLASGVPVRFDAFASVGYDDDEGVCDG